VDQATRHVFFEACFNFRDLGGYQTADGHLVRWATLYRSDTLHRLTAADAAAFNALGLRTVIDLRSLTEIDQFGRLGVGREDLVWRSVPMLDNVRLVLPDPFDPPVVASLPDPATPGEGYLRIAEEFAPSIAEVFRVLAGDDALPAVFHCTSGKDRTGILAALVLEVLGVADEVVASDYVLTEEAGPRSMRWIRANEPSFADFLAHIPAERRAARPERILGLLDELRAKYGSIPEFLMRSGVAAAQLDALRDRLVEP
jgi:protein-tyrosine phosphatase